MSTKPSAGAGPLRVRIPSRAISTACSPYAGLGWRRAATTGGCNSRSRTARTGCLPTSPHSAVVYFQQGIDGVLNVFLDLSDAREMLQRHRVATERYKGAPMGGLQELVGHQGPRSTVFASPTARSAMIRQLEQRPADRQLDTVWRRRMGQRRNVSAYNEIVG
jgi:hypothetical protein